MRANFDDQNRKKLTKKCWSYVKSTSKSTRIPEVVYLKGKTSLDPKTKVCMFRCLMKFSTTNFLKNQSMT